MNFISKIFRRKKNENKGESSAANAEFQSTLPQNELVKNPDELEETAQPTTLKRGIPGEISGIYEHS